MAAATKKSEPFETETMAELCARQGRVGEALAIYERLLAAAAPPGPAHAAWRERAAELRTVFARDGGGATSPADLPLPPAPGVLAQAGDNEAMLAWSLPPDTVAPALDVFMIVRAASGVETARRTIPLEAASGRLGLPVTGLHSVIAAVGQLVEGRFVPWARSPRGA